MKESNENIATNVCCLASSFVCRSLKGTLSLEVKDVEGQRSHVHSWQVWEPGLKADLAGAKCFSLITPSPDGFAFWMPPTRKQPSLEMRLLEMAVVQGIREHL